MMTFAQELLLELVRTEDAGDSFAFRTGRQEYVLRGEGGGAESVELTWSQALLGDLAALHEPGCDPAIVQRVGRTLRAFLESDGWARQEARLTEAVSRGQPVVVTIRSAAAELYALPWELLTLGASGQHLGELPSVLVRYEWPETVTAPESPSPRHEGGRVLFAWSSAGGRVPVLEHLRAIEDGAKAGHYPFDARRDVLERATYGRLDDVLEAARVPGGTPISVLHLLCHGGAAGQTCGLVLDSEDEGEPTVVDAGRLRQLLTPYVGMVRLVVIAACNGGNMGVLGNQLGSVAQALHQIGIGTVIASRFPLSIPGSNRFSEIFYRELFGGPASVEAAFLSARRQLARDTGRLDWASLQLYACEASGHDNRPVVLRPYRGLLAFQPEHSRFFFGRDAEINEIINELGALSEAGSPRFLVIAGSSGTGKSSVVLAGAIPRMLQAPGSSWVFARMRPGAEPLAALDVALATRQEQGRHLLLVVDQFEEVFTQTESTRERNTFVRRLWALARQADSGVSVLVTLRVDFIGRCGELLLDDTGLRLDKVSYDEAHRVFVAQMTQAQLEEAICKPAQRVGLLLQEGLARRMLQDVEGEPGALPLLQDTLDMLWQRRQGRVLTQAAYDAIGGVCGALSLRADARIDELDEAGKLMARRLLLRLVSVHSDTTMDTRRRARLAEVRPRDAEAGGRFERILGRFVDERLLVCTGDGKATTVEVAHEALIRNWQMLRGWVEQERGRLLALQEIASKVQEWKKHGALLNERQLSLVEAVAQDGSEELDDDTRKLIEESRADARRKQRLKQGVMAGLLTVAVVLALLGWWGMRESREARAQAQQARDATRLSVAQRVAYEPEMAIALLREVEEQKPSELQTHGWLVAVPHFTSPVFRGRTPIELTGHTQPVLSASFSADGKYIVTLSSDGTARVWTPNGTAAGRPLEVEGERIVSAGFSPDGTRLVTGSNTGAVRVWQVDGTPVGQPFEGHTAPVSSVLFSPDGERLFTSSSDGSARVWMADGTAVGKPLTPEKGMSRLAFNADGTRLVTLVEGTARVWKSDGTHLRTLEHKEGLSFTSATFNAGGTHILTDATDHIARVWTAEGSLVSALPANRRRITATAMSADGERVITALEDGTAGIWQVAGYRTGTLVALLKSHLGAINAVAFSSDGAHVVTASADGTARVWTAEGAFIADLKGHQGGINSVAFSPDGTRIITASNDKTARVWTSDGSLVTEIKRQGWHRMRHRGGREARPGPSAAFSADGARIVTTLGEKAWMWKTAGDLIAELKGHQVLIKSSAFSPDGRYVATAAVDGKARVFGMDGGLVAELAHQEPIVSSAAFSADGTRVVTVSGSVPVGRDRVGVWMLDSKTRIASFQGHGKVLSAVFGPGGLRIAASLDDTTVGVWTADGALVARLTGHSSAVTLATFSADGQRIFTASEDGSARVWNADGTRLAHFERFGVKILSAAFSADNMFVVMGSADGVARLWTVDGSLVVVLGSHGDGGPVHSVAFSPSGDQVITTSEDSVSRVWTIQPDAVRRELWLSTRFCLGTKDRMSLLNAQEAIAEAGYQNCTEMVRCLGEGSGGERYPSCLEEYRRKERERFYEER